MIEIRPVRPEDSVSVQDVQQRAFDGRIYEARLVDLLHVHNKALVSLVAVLDDRVVGHILFSAVSLDPPQPRLNLVGLAPLAVLPEFQRQGIGARLSVEGLQMCRAAGYDAVVVLGHPSYYSRFGFMRASDYGLGNEYGADAAFMVVELKRGVLDNVQGRVKYQPEFEEADR